MSAYKSLDDLFAARDLKGLRVLVRCDLNVPITDGRVSDVTRLTRIAPTLDELARKGAKVVVLSHFGRPKKGPDPELSLSPVAAALAGVLGEDVNFAGDCIGPTAAHAVSALPDGEVLVLENTRFYPEEEENDPTFAKASPRWAMSTSMTPFPAPIARTPRPRASPGCCPPMRGAAWKRN